MQARYHRGKEQSAIRRCEKHWQRVAPASLTSFPKSSRFMWITAIACQKRRSLMSGKRFQPTQDPAANPAPTDNPDPVSPDVEPRVDASLPPALPLCPLKELATPPRPTWPMPVCRRNRQPRQRRSQLRTRQIPGATREAPPLPQ